MTTTTKNLQNENEIDNLLNRLETADDNDRSWMTDISDYRPSTTKPETTPDWRITLHG